MQLQSARDRFEAQGLKLAAISYDSEAILKDFAERHRIDFPLLADPHSEIIRSFGVLNREAKGMTAGMAYPGFFYLDANGIICEKYFIPKYTDRLTADKCHFKALPGGKRGGAPESQSTSSRACSCTIRSQCHPRRPGQPDCRNRASSGCSRLFSRSARLQADSAFVEPIARRRIPTRCLPKLQNTLSRSYP